MNTCTRDWTQLDLANRILWRELEQRCWIM